MRLPKELKILGRIFKVRYVDFEKALPNSGNSGLISHLKQEIHIDDGCHKEYKEAALLHEIVHSINRELAIGLEEEDVMRLNNGLYQVLKDNKFLKED